MILTKSYRLIMSEFLKQTEILKGKDFKVWFVDYWKAEGQTVSACTIQILSEVI